MNETIKLGRYLNKMMVSILLCSSILYGGGYIDEDVANWSKTSKKIYTHTYYFNHKKFVLEKLFWPVDAKIGEREIFYTLKIYKRGAKKPYYAYRADGIELINTPYQFPYIVFNFLSFGSSHTYNYLYIFDTKGHLKRVQAIGDVALDTLSYKDTNTQTQGKRFYSNYSSYMSNPIVIGKDGKYYVETWKVADTNATCNSQDRYDRVIYRFRHGKFQKYKRISFKDENVSINDVIF